MERLSKSARERLAQDDAEIKMYERKLGIKGRKSSRKDDDGLEGLLGEEGMDMDQSDEDSKRKREEYDTWLASKRRKSTHQSGKLKGVATYRGTEANREQPPRMTTST